MRAQDLISVENPRIYPGLGLALDPLALTLRDPLGRVIERGVHGLSSGKMQVFLLKYKRPQVLQLRETEGQALALLLTCRVTLFKWLNFPGPQCPHPLSEANYGDSLMSYYDV